MAGTDQTRGVSRAGPAIILVAPQLGENIGTAARAMANFGLADLRLVTPRDGWPSETARKAASGADFVIDAARIFPTLAEAIEDLSFVFATTARPRDVVKPVVTPEAAARATVARIAAGQRVGILFGRERWGLENDEVSLADELVTFPANPGFSSFNLAQAVLLIGYEWFKASRRGDIDADANARAREPASRADLMALFKHLETSLDEAGFLHPPEKRPAMERNLRALLHRAQLSGQEVRSLRGVIKALTGEKGRRGKESGT